MRKWWNNDFIFWVCYEKIMVDPISEKPSFPEYVKPTAPGHAYLSEKRSTKEEPGERLFVVVEHFLSWVIANAT